MTMTKKKPLNKKQLDAMIVAPEPSANENVDKAIVIQSFRDIVASVMNEAQFNILQGRTPKSVIKTRPGKGGKIFSYVPHGYVTTQLNRAFGFDWDRISLPMGNGKHYEIIEGLETINKKGEKIITPRSIIVNIQLTLRIRNPKDLTQVIATIIKTATGEKEFVPGMTWGSMIKSAESDGEKKAATKLGVALDLYWQDADEDYLENGNAVKAKELAQQGKSKPEIAKELGVSVADAIKLLNGKE